MRHGTAVWSVAIITGLVLVAAPAAAQPEPPGGPVPTELAAVLEPVTKPLNEAVDPVTDALAPVTDPAEAVTTAVHDGTGIDLRADSADSTDDSTTPAQEAGGVESGDPDGDTPAGASSSGTLSVSADGGSGVAVDGEVAGLVSVCVRIDPDGAEGPLAATVRLLDEDVLASLNDAGVPVQQLVVPCPAPNDEPAEAGPAAGAVGDVSDDGPPASATAASRVPSADRLPYTGSPVAGLAAAGAGLLLSGATLLRRFRRSAAPA